MPPKVGNLLGNIDKKEGGMGGFGTHGDGLNKLEIKLCLNG